MSAPLVSVIIAVKNAEAYLADCLASVMAQTFTDFEIVMVDGASTDGTGAIARACPKVRFLQQTGKGFADAWNCGLREARGDLLAFIDSDDRWTPRKLEIQVQHLHDNPASQAVIGKVTFFLEPGETPPRGFRDKVLTGEHDGLMPGALMARRGLFDVIGDWGQGWVIANDIDWFLKLKDSGLPLAVLDEVVIEKRVHSRNISYVMAEDRVYPQEVLRLLHASIQRKRAAATNA